MRNKTILIAIIAAIACQAKAQFAYGDRWYNNPLGFNPVNLHTSMAFFIPAVAVGTCALLTKKDSTLTKRLSIYDEVGLSWGYKYPYTFFPQNNTGINYQLRKFMSIGVDLNICLPRDNFNNTTGFGIRPFARFYAVNRPAWRLYFESGGGLVFFTSEFSKPTDRDNRLGTHLNGITKYGIGGDVNISKSTSIMFGIRHLHVSNGNTIGVQRNPSHDSNGLFLGLTYKI